ncbi:MAG: hypothetical protein GXO47_03530 [Chlorobi bacterium]|nr:hypothetical protein [Chlorobiota bacterium]
MKNALSLIFVSVLILTTEFSKAQEPAPVNSNYLYENGISPKVLDIAASQFMQDGSFKNDVIITRVKNGKKKTFNVELIYDPEYQEGMDIRVINKSEQLTPKEQKELRKYIEKSHYFSRMARDYFYDESSLKTIKNKNDTLILEYYYQQKNIDPYLKNVKRLKGIIYIIDGKLEKIVLKQDKPLKRKILYYEKTVLFSKTKNGGYIINSTDEHTNRKEKGELLQYSVKSRTIEYKSSTGKEVEWAGKPHISYNTDIRYDTINVKLGGPLPLLGKEARKIGFDLPRPFGVAVFSHIQSQNMDITRLSVGINGGDMTDLQNILTFNESDVTLNSTINLAKADMWLFPFLNIMAIVGGGKNELNAQLKMNQELIDFLDKLPGYIIDPPNLPDYIPINSTLTSEIYGGGVTLAGGIGDFNISVNYQLMFTNIVEANTTNMVNIITPMVGYMAPFGVNFMAGAQGQFYETEVTGYFKLTDSNGQPFSLDYVIDFEPMKWNGMIGLYKNFINKHWEMSLQAGFGERTSVTAVFGYRF